MTVKQDIQNYLSQNGRSKVSEIANGIGYSDGHVRQNAKEMASNGTIQGTKIPKRIPAVIINGELEVLGNSRKRLLSIVRKHAPHRTSQVNSLATKDIRSLIENQLADRTLAISQDVWEFW
jgi:hypothetical protein